VIARLSAAEARSLGITVEGTTRKRTKHVAVGGPYHWRCQCGVEGTGETAATRHLNETKHSRYETIYLRGEQ
jgi:hypothetical protein